MTQTLHHDTLCTHFSQKVNRRAWRAKHPGQFTLSDELETRFTLLKKDHKIIWRGIYDHFRFSFDRYQ